MDEFLLPGRYPKVWIEWVNGWLLLAVGYGIHQGADILPQAVSFDPHDGHWTRGEARGRDVNQDPGYKQETSLNIWSHPHWPFVTRMAATILLLHNLYFSFSLPMKFNQTEDASTAEKKRRLVAIFCISCLEITHQKLVFYTMANVS